MIPEYDLEWNERPIQRTILRVHVNLSVYSATLNTRASFFWLPRINEDLFTLLKKWQTGVGETPTVLVIG